MKFDAYLIFCQINNKGYIGITSRGLRRRWNEHLYDARARGAMAISRAISKHGSNNFSIVSLAQSESWAGICAIEKELIRKHGTRTPGGYNVSDGGEGPFGIKRSPESVERSAAKHRGKPCHPNTREASRKTHLGCKKSDLHRARISAAKKGIPRSEQVKEKIRAYWAKRRANEEFKTSLQYEHSKKGVSV